MKAFAAILILSLGLAFLGRFGLGKVFRWGERKLARFALRRDALLWVAVGSFCLLASLSSICRLGVPRVMDEFSYLLQADTFVHGRLANPPHPLWKFFETFHVLQQPSYASKYPPAQATFLALGMTLGHPIIGVWISAALAMAALFWALTAVVPRRWALLGVLLMFFNPQVLTWSWDYWGGTVALGAGALVTGGYWRLRRRLSIKHAAIMATGIGIAALCRPFEGFVLTGLISAALLYDWLKQRFSPLQILTATVLPATGVLAIAASFLLFYNFRVTGHALTMPYMVYEKTYSQNPIFLWQAVMPAPKYNDKQFDDFYTRDLRRFKQSRSPQGYLNLLKERFLEFDKLSWFWFLPLLMIVPPLRGGGAVTGRPSFVLLILFGAITGLLATYMLPHYVAPALTLALFLLIGSIRRLRALKRYPRHLGLNFVRAFILFLCAFSLFGFIKKRKFAERNNWEFYRANLLNDLRKDGKKHLLLVRYSTDHNINAEWVYNEADIDQAKVVWARDLGEKENEELLHYFKDREVTVIEPDSGRWGK